MANGRDKSYIGGRIELSSCQHLPNFPLKLEELLTENGNFFLARSLKASEFRRCHWSAESSGSFYLRRSRWLQNAILPSSVTN